MIEVYGIDDRRCYGCRRVKSLLDELNYDYTFYPVLVHNDDDIVYDRPLIESLAKRLNLTRLNIGYPVIFCDGTRIKNFAEFKDYLLLRGADPNIILDYS